jgi:hypothetical protein
MATIAWNEERTMDRKKLIAYLRRSAAGKPECTPFCPDDNDIAAYVDADLSDSARILIERHLPDCPACVSRVGLLMRLMRGDAANVTTAASVPAKTWRQITPQWAVAATVVLTIGWLAWSPSVDQFDDYEAVRTISSVLTPPEILAPSSGILGERDGFVIRWTEVPGSLYYEIRVVTDAGDLLSEARVENTEWTIGQDLGLEPGREYFIRVDAYLSDAKAIRSDHIPFKLRE